MPLEEFWHGDMRLLECYQKAYLRNVSYTAWLNGQYNYAAFSTVIGNAFAKKGTKAQKYPSWSDPIEKVEKEKKKNITKDNLEYEFRKEQAKQQQWLRSLFDKK